MDWTRLGRGAHLVRHSDTDVPTYVRMCVGLCRIRYGDHVGGRRGGNEGKGREE